MDVQAEIHRALDDHPQVTIFDYPAEHHGFADTFGTQGRRTQLARLTSAQWISSN